MLSLKVTKKIFTLIKNGTYVLWARYNLSQIPIGQTHS